MHISLPVKFALVSFIITLVGVVGVAMMAYNESDQLLQQEAVSRLAVQVRGEADTLESEAARVRSDVSYLAHSQQIQHLSAWFSTGHASDQPVHMQAFDFGPIESLCASILVQREMYYQVRIIGLADDGQELVRVVRLPRGITTIGHDGLMQKGKRGYFLEALKLQPGEFLFSKITLNREYGMITQPPQPMLRVSTGLFDSRGKLFAVLLINIDFDVFANLSRPFAGEQQFFIVNAEGDYLIHPDSRKAMAFEYGRQARLQNDFNIGPEHLQHSRQYGGHQINQYLFDAQGQVLILSDMHFDTAHPQRFLQLGASLTLHQLRAQSRALRDRMLWLTVGLALFLGLLTYYLARYFTRPVRDLTQVAGQISQGAQDVTIPSAGHDEVGLLSVALQRMVEHLRQARQQSEALNAELEEKVHQRTTELEHLTAKLEAQNAALEQAVQTAEQAAVAKSQFLATMSHEIRTPLNGILGITELVLAEEMYPAQRGRMEVIQSSGQALLTILNDILDFSKIEAGQMEIKLTSFNPNEVIEHVANLFARQVNTDESRLELIARGIPNLPCLLIGDSDRLHQVMLNLLSNAAKFTEQGDIIISVDLLSETDATARVRFQLADSGRGISAEDQQRLFEEFTQADGTDTRKHGGTGLGLAIVKRLVAMMGGEIMVESEVGKGSRFYFDLELEKSDVLDDGPHLFAGHFAQWRVLVVDDHASNREMLGGLLGGWGADCDVCSSAQDALKFLHDALEAGQPYDLTLIDKQIEDMDGMALARVIREMPQLASLKVIMTTTLDMAFDAEMRDTYGLDGFIRKPVYVHSLFETVLDVMGVRQRRSRHESIISHEQRSERILLAEDNAVNRQVAMGMLENQGFVHVDAAHDGAEALRMVAENSYDLVLMDVQMPELDGISATRQIRQQEATSEQLTHVPIIALTAHALAEDVQRCRQAGMDAHLNKPLTGAALREMLVQWLPARDESVSDSKGWMEETVASTDAGVSEACEAAVNEAELRQLRADMGFGIGMIIDTYVNELPGQVEAIRQAIDDADGDALRRNGHRLKGASRSVAAAVLGDICFRLEQMGQRGQHEDFVAASALFDTFTQAVAAVQQSLAADWVNEIR